MIRINDEITLQDWELSESFMRSSGPGGQNVNKVSSAVELRFEALRSPNIPPDAKARLKTLAGRRWTSEGTIVITSEKTRSQPMNRADAEAKLVELVLRSLIRPKRRVPTKPTLGSKVRRVDGKVQRGVVKALRGAVEEE